MQPPVAERPPIVCGRLRSKGTPGLSYEDSVGFAAGWISTATFWCTATAEAIGPDDDTVHPHTCVEGRGCFATPRPQDRA